MQVTEGHLQSPFDPMLSNPKPKIELELKRHIFLEQQIANEARKKRNYILQRAKITTLAHRNNPKSTNLDLHATQKSVLFQKHLHQQQAKDHSRNFILKCENVFPQKRNKAPNKLY